MRFYLGTHMPAWLTKTAAPLFISAVRLRKRKRFPQALGGWALDSGGFSELSLHGEWTIGAAQYVEEVRQWSDAIGNLDWAAIQDWMCEPDIRAKTGKTVEEHQQLTLRSYLDLMTLAPDLPWIPIVQGWTIGEYEDHVELYAQHGVQLDQHPVVGVGSVCRRQAAIRGPLLISQLATMGLNVHAFGLKRTGLEALKQLTSITEDDDTHDCLKQPFRGIASADSMAWSFHARREKNGKQNDINFALEWREDTLEALGLGRKPKSLQGGIAAQKRDSDDFDVSAEAG